MERYIDAQGRWSNNPYMHYGEAPLLRKYANEPAAVRNHVQLFALERRSISD